MGEKRAVLVACNYAGTGCELVGTSDDLKAMSQMLQETYEVPQDNIQFFNEGGKWSQPVTGAAVRAAFAQAAASSEPGDSLLFYFAGHGARLPAPSGDNWALILSDLDVITRADYNAVTATIKDGVKFTAIHDCSCGHMFLPNEIQNEPGEKLIAASGSRFLPAPKYFNMFNAKYPEANMGPSNIIQAIKAAFPQGASKITQASGEQGGPAQPQRRRRGGWRSAGPIGEGRERDGDDEEEEEEGDDGERRRRNDSREREGRERREQRRRRRPRRDGEEGSEEEDEEEEEEEGGEGRPGRPDRPDRPEGGRHERPERPDRPDEDRPDEERPERPEGDRPDRPDRPEGEAEGEEDAPAPAPGHARPPPQQQAAPATGDKPQADEGDAEGLSADQEFEAVTDPSDNTVRKHCGVLFSASVFRSNVPDKQGGGAFTRALIGAIKASKESGEPVTNAALMTATQATLQEGGFKMAPALVCSPHNSQQPFFVAAEA